MQLQTDYKFEYVINLVLLIVTMLIFAGIAILTIFEIPPAVYISAMQAMILDGAYYPILTIFVLFIPSFIPIIILKLGCILIFNLFFVKEGEPKIPYFYKVRWQ